MATKRQIFIACQCAVMEALSEKDTVKFSVEKLAYLAIQYGTRAEVTKAEAEAMLTKTMHEIVL